MRINKYLAQCNIASRRKVEEFVVNGCVKVNNVVITNLATMVAETDVVKLNNVVVMPTGKKVYYLLNKPKNIITSAVDEKGRDTVLDLVHSTERIFPVGRLDYGTEGMLVLTNDGDFANKLIHPSKTINKTYEVVVNRQPSISEFEKLLNGVKIEDYVTSPSKITNKQKLASGNFLFYITIHEGRNRQVRKMMESVNLKVIALKRIKIGSLPLGNLPVGKYKVLTANDLKLLLSNEGE